MKIRIEDEVDEIYEGSPSDIMKKLWHKSFDRKQFPNLDRYMTHISETFERMTDMPCELPRGSTDERARALLLRLTDIDALEVIEDE